jgi:drug/metabolite transporter (DMT)-like permease
MTFERGLTKYNMRKGVIINSLWSKNGFQLMIGLAAAALFGSATPASKALLKSLNPFQLAGMLYLGAAIGVLPMIFRDETILVPWKLPQKTKIQLLGAITFGGLFGPVFLLLGLQMASSASVSLWLNLELVATVILGVLFFHDNLTWSSGLAVFGTLLASIILSIGEDAAGISAGLLVFLACLCWGLDNHLTALIDGITPPQTTMWKGIVAGSINLIIGLLFAPVVLSVGTWVLALIVGIFAYGVSIVLYIISAQQMGATRSQIIFSSSPFFGLLLSAILLGESISAFQISALVLIMISLGFLLHESHTHKHAHVEMSHDHWHRHDDLQHRHGHPQGNHKLWHRHLHNHRPVIHSHRHQPDLHHRHPHQKD